MGLFKPDFFRFLALGFLMGMAAMGVSAGSSALASSSAADAAIQAPLSAQAGR